MRIETVIITYNRPKMLQRLVNQLANSTVKTWANSVKGKGFAVDNSITVVHDGPTNHVPVGADVVRNSKEHTGRDKWHELINHVFECQREADWDYFILLNDDVEVKPDFYEKAVTAFENIADKNKVCLNLLTTDKQFHRPQWGIKPPGKYRLNSEISLDGDIIYCTYWVDTMFICNRRFFEELEYKINPIVKPDPWTSTGVGKQISMRLVEKGCTLWQLPQTLVTHGAHDSLLHPLIKKEDREVYT